MSKIIRGYKFKIYPTEEQKEKLNRFIELHRAVYNWAVEQEEKIYSLYKDGKSDHGFYSFITLSKMYTIERNKPGNEYLLEIPETTARTALQDVVNAYKMFFNGTNNYPKFKKKNKCKKSFGTRKDRFYIKNSKIKIEGIKDHIDLGFNFKDIRNPIDPVITLDNLGEYYVSFNLEEHVEDLISCKTEPIGIDLGCRQTFSLSTGEIYNQPKEKIDRLQNQINRLNKQITRDQKRRLKQANRTRTKYEDIPKSKRAIKRELKRNKKYKKIHNIKETFYHTITKQIVMRNPEYICMETFSVRTIQETKPYLNDKLVSVSFYRITEMMKYKCKIHNVPFIQAPMDFASTQICNHCGNKKKMYNYHTYKCSVCGMVEDRDINAAINLRNYGSQFI